MNVNVTPEISAEAYLRRLAERGVEHIFVNPGTDFAPIVEALSRQGNRRYPRFITVPHENAAMSMAHGYYRTCGKPPVVMVHVTVGTANAICGLMNAARDNIPLLLAAGRTPITEMGHIASRNSHIHWGQESYDQGGMVREFVKWDYELRHGQPVESVVDRALDLAMSEPRGPVYLTLPREVLADPVVSPRRSNERALGAIASHPDPAAIAELARLVAEAELPVIVTSNIGRDPKTYAALAELAEASAIPVVQSVPNELNLPTDHPMHLGYEPNGILPDADLIVVLDSAVPWIPVSAKLKPGVKIVHLSADPLVSGVPFRDFEADRLITGSSRAAVLMVQQELKARAAANRDRVERRRQAVAARRAAIAVKRKSLLETARNQTPIHPVWLTTCVNDVKAADAIVVNELGLNVAHLSMAEHGSYIGGNMSGGLGFGLGAALGAKLAAPSREVIAVVGDGSYMFGNPLPYHFVSRAEKLPTLTIVANNHAWHAVRNATLSVYPGGDAAKTNVMPLTTLDPSPAFEKMIDVCGGYGECVERPEDLPAALARGLAAVRSGTPALLNVHTRGRH
jgi:acetolactate synthase I/II/III large subunit